MFVLECDELWSFVGNKNNKLWVWLAYDKLSKQIIGVYVGKRDKTGAQGLFDSIPEDYKQYLSFYTDYWDAYNAVIPEWSHFPCHKKFGRTNHIERFNNTTRQRLSRFARKSLSFSRKEINHQGALIHFINKYNKTIQNREFA